jgi:hypothetical protein
LPEKKANALASEKSPYLLQHAFNPVEWRPWGEEALKKARNDGKPIFLSIGYSSCHWCHRMAHESFEDETTAEMINRSFVPIKVDREERPDLDAYYMGAVQAITGGGGWPLSVFLTPDLKPFYGGTYYPPEPRDGMPSFSQVLEFVAKAWKERRDDALDSADRIAKVLAEAQNAGVKSELSMELVDGGYQALASSFDPEYGGFGAAPKFPLPLSVSFMLRYHFRTGNELALRAAVKTLDAMAAGGIRDHLGGGFHRYSTDRVWIVPHFEKMLYDNALLSKTFFEAYQATGNERYAKVGRETLGWVLEEMAGPEGGFYSAQDADTAEGEGAFYTWTPEDVESVLSGEAGSEFCSLYGVTRVGNFEGGRSILHLSNGGREEGKAADEWRERLYRDRAGRPKPRTDTKVLASWNGLAVSALAFGGSALRDQKYLKAATKAASFVLRKCAREGRLLRRYAGGEAGIAGMLEDYAFVAQGLLDLFEATSEVKWLEEATRLTDLMMADFLDSEKGGFYISLESHPARMVDAHDGPVPSGNSVAAMNLIRISEMTGKEKLKGLARKTIARFGSELEDQPAAHAYMMSALDLLLNGVKEVVITAPSLEKASEMVGVVRSGYAPNVVLVQAVPGNYENLTKLSSLLEGRRPGTRAVAYVCENSACKVPANSASELRAQLRQA